MAIDRDMVIAVRAQPAESGKWTVAIEHLDSKGYSGVKLSAEEALNIDPAKHSWVNYVLVSTRTPVRSRALFSRNSLV